MRLAVGTPCRASKKKIHYFKDVYEIKSKIFYEIREILKKKTFLFRLSTQKTQIQRNSNKILGNPKSQ
jgi:hypothetical protein